MTRAVNNVDETVVVGTPGVLIPPICSSVPYVYRPFRFTLTAPDTTKARNRRSLGIANDQVVQVIFPFPKGQARGSIGVIRVRG